jgi:hypothetical protein
MSEETSSLVGPDGQPIKTVNIPVVNFEDFVFPMAMVTEEEICKVTEQGVKPSAIIKELRAISREMRHRFTILAAGLVVASKEGPEGVENFLNSIGLVITDAKGQTFFSPKVDTDVFTEEKLNEPAVAETELKKDSSDNSEEVSG